MMLNDACALPRVRRVAPRFGRVVRRATGKLVASAVEKVVLGQPDVEMPAKLVQAFRQLYWVIEDLVDLELRSVIKAAAQHGSLGLRQAVIHGR